MNGIPTLPMIGFVSHNVTMPTYVFALHPQGELLGDFHYMCPKFLETGHLTESNDIYAFGVVLCELLTGSPPYESCRDPPYIVEFLRRAISSPRQLQEAVDSVVKWKKKSCTSFARIAIACVQCDPHNRPNIEIIIQDIEHILDGLKRSHHEHSLLDGQFDAIGNDIMAASNQAVSLPDSPSSFCDAASPRGHEDLVVHDLIELQEVVHVPSVTTSQRICPLSNYGLPIENIGHSFSWGSLLASNPRLLCCCSATTNDNSVHILDLWEMEKGRVVKFGSSTPLKSANVSPNQNEAFIAAQVC